MRIHLKTFGCSANHAESEMMAGLLSDKHTFSDCKKSDAVVINACTVKGDDTVLRYIRTVKEENPQKRIIIGGCLSATLRKQVQTIDPTASFITTQNIHDINDAVDTPGLVQLRATKKPKLLLPRAQTQSGIAIIPISNGCMDHCTYCSTKLSKGNLQSYPPADILEEMNQSIEHAA